jgi:hypothetical protein
MYIYVYSISNIVYIYTWAQAVIGDLVDNHVILSNSSTYSHLVTTRRVEDYADGGVIPSEAWRRVEDSSLGPSVVDKRTIHELNVHLHLRRTLTRPTQAHIISGTQLLRCQYMYFCTSKASTSVLESKFTSLPGSFDHRPYSPPAYVSIRQHTSAYVSVRQHTSAYVSVRQRTSAYVSVCQHSQRHI